MGKSPTIVWNSSRSVLRNVSRDTKHFDCDKRVDHLGRVKTRLSTYKVTMDTVSRTLLTSPLAVEPFGLGNCCPLITCTEEKRAQIHVTKSGIDIFLKKR